MMRSLSTRAFGQPSETKEILGAIGFDCHGHPLVASREITLGCQEPLAQS